MCCSNNEFSVCKVLAIFIGLIAGAVTGILLGFFPVLLTDITAALWIIFGISLVLVASSAALSVYTSGTRASQCLVKCFNPLGTFSIIVGAISLLLSVAALGIPVLEITIAAAIIIGITVGFFIALVIIFLCFVICLNRKTCRG